ncbi:MAG: matrixin family metalloprotease [Phycisphaerales bacterium]|nr:MAG: matrixin family metalloprotease [Phycisphaerales bacterium]
MATRACRIRILSLLLPVGLCGCSETLFIFGDRLGDLSDGIDTIEQCVSPLEPADLGEVFAGAVPVNWNGDTAQLSDDTHQTVADYYAGQLSSEVLPAYYLNERIFHLGSMTSGDRLEVEILSDVVSDVWFYDSGLTFAGGRAHDLDGNRIMLTFPINSENPDCFLRFNFFYLSNTGKPIAHITRTQGTSPGEPRGQTVVLNFAGWSQLTFRSGSLKPTDVGPTENAIVRAAVVQTFRETFAGYNVVVLSSDDPPPAQPYSIIHIGPADPRIGTLGQAEHIDFQNAVPDDVAVVDTNHRALSAASLLGPEVLGAALGKVAAHEMGHLLGLHHVSDPNELMTGAGCQGVGLDPLAMLNRQFARAPVSSFTNDFFVGYQDAPAILRDIVGISATDTP